MGAVFPFAFGFAVGRITPRNPNAMATVGALLPFVSSFVILALVGIVADYLDPPLFRVTVFDSIFGSVIILPGLFVVGLIPSIIGFVFAEWLKKKPLISENPRPD